jgi:hypothetical protein
VGELFGSDAIDCTKSFLLSLTRSMNSAENEFLLVFFLLSFSQHFFSFFADSNGKEIVFTGFEDENKAANSIELE